MIKNGLPAIHPGVFLREILDEHQWTQAQFAKAAGVSPMRISYVLNGARSINADLALRIGFVMGQTAQYWLNLQNAYDIKIATANLRKHSAAKMHKMLTAT